MLPSITIPDNVKFCFFTGLPLEQSKGPQERGGEPLMCSQEHLISKTLLRKRKVVMSNKGHGRGGINLVHASALVNSIVGHAPIKVKFALKKHFEGIEFLSMDKEYLRKTLRSILKDFFNSYRVHGLYPWEWNVGKLTKTERKEVYEALLTLLTDEEKEFRLHQIM